MVHKENQHLSRRAWRDPTDWYLIRNYAPSRWPSQFLMIWKKWKMTRVQRSSGTDNSLAWMEESLTTWPWDQVTRNGTAESLEHTAEQLWVEKQSDGRHNSICKRKNRNRDWEGLSTSYSSVSLWGLQWKVFVTQQFYPILWVRPGVLWQMSQEISSQIPFLLWSYERSSK